MKVYSLPSTEISLDAAGIAAALAVKRTDTNVHKISVPDLHQKLLKAGAYLP